VDREEEGGKGSSKKEGKTEQGGCRSGWRKLTHIRQKKKVVL
jgi:hypothetical protein